MARKGVESDMPSPKQRNQAGLHGETGCWRMRLSTTKQLLFCQATGPPKTTGPCYAIARHRLDKNGATLAFSVPSTGRQAARLKPCKEEETGEGRSGAAGAGVISLANVRSASPPLSQGTIASPSQDVQQQTPAIGSSNSLVLGKVYYDGGGERKKIKIQELKATQELLVLGFCKGR